MHSETTENNGDTVKLRRPPPRVFTEPQGQTVWMGDVDVLELELVDDVECDPYNNVNNPK